MKKLTSDLNLWIVRNAHSNKTRTIFFLFTLSLFILSAGAPDANRWDWPSQHYHSGILILLVAVLVGLGLGLIRARITKRTYQPTQLKGIWLVFLAFIPQLLIFNILPTSFRPSRELVSWVLVLSQIPLLIFAGLNWRRAGFWLLGIGLALNFLVIVLNGGMMPISPDLVTRLLPDAPPGFWRIGEQLGIGKDIVLPIDQTRLYFLSDRFTLPEWIPYRVAFSLGDVVISAGTCWLLWSLGGKQKQELINEVAL